jgi:NitT/TauT family transport system permease protein
VLAFLPGLVIALISVFPTTNLGLELACVIMIFTGQAWNMTFSFYHSLRSIPAPLREVSQMSKFGWWKRFTMLELPSSAIGLIWNSMMSMAGGWFFLSVCEAFTLGEHHDFRLPGIGAYMSVAIERGNVSAMVWGIVAMLLVIAIVDQLIWRPIVTWSAKFTMEEVSQGNLSRSFVLDLFRSSRLADWIRRRVFGGLRRAVARSRARPRGPSRPLPAMVTRGLGLVPLILLTVLALLGAVKLGDLVMSLGATTQLDLMRKAGMTFSRILGAIAIGSLWTIPVGVMIGQSRVLSRRLQPVIQMAASFPAPMLYWLLIPAFALAGIPFGFGAMLLMLLGTQWYILFNVVAGAASIPADIREAADMCRLSTVRRWRTLILPAIFPSLVTGWITAAGGAWNASIVAEFVPTRGSTLVADGLGATISQATEKADFALLAASAALMAVVVVTINRFVWRRLGRIAESRFSLGA